MLIILNWKMFLSPQQELQRIKDYTETFSTLATRHTIALFPSFLSLSTLAPLLRSTHISLGAQDCSEHTYGAHTGQVAAAALAELGCTYVLLGHAERRALGETDELIARKARQAMTAGLQPIVCISELASVAHYSFLPNPIIAYEPISAIGTGKPPSIAEIDQTLRQIKQQLPHATVLYGGSVTNTLAPQLTTIALDGVLIGKASLDIQELVKIVESLK
jgi:triosephosphate isomerase (TIM)